MGLPLLPQGTGYRILSDCLFVPTWLKKNKCYSFPVQQVSLFVPNILLYHAPYYFGTVAVAILLTCAPQTIVFASFFLSLSFVFTYIGLLKAALSLSSAAYRPQLQLPLPLGGGWWRRLPDRMSPFSP